MVRTIAAATTVRVRGAPLLPVNAWGVRYARECVLRGDPLHWAAAWRALKGLDVQGRLERFGYRGLVLAGELDASTTPEIMAAIVRRIPGAVYEVLPATPHMQTLERPELVTQALNRFLPRIGSGSGDTPEAR
jgi:3-oxoadipate enol-lactonase